VTDAACEGILRQCVKYGSLSVRHKHLRFLLNVGHIQWVGAVVLARLELQWFVIPIISRQRDDQGRRSIRKYIRIEDGSRNEYFS
jgi:hypothetical protein